MAMAEYKFTYVVQFLGGKNNMRSSGDKHVTAISTDRYIALYRPACTPTVGSPVPVPILCPLKPLGPSQHYRIERALNRVPIMPWDASLSDNGCKFFQPWLSVHSQKKNLLPFILKGIWALSQLRIYCWFLYCRLFYCQLLYCRLFLLIQKYRNSKFSTIRVDNNGSTIRVDQKVSTIKSR